MTEEPIRHRRREPLSLALWDALFKTLAFVVMAAFVWFLLWTLTSDVLWLQIVGGIAAGVFSLGTLFLILYGIAFDRTR